MHFTLYTRKSANCRDNFQHAHCNQPGSQRTEPASPSSQCIGINSFTQQLLMPPAFMQLKSCAIIICCWQVVSWLNYYYIIAAWLCLAGWLQNIDSEYQKFDT